MLELAKAGFNFSWSMPLFGAQQLAWWLAPTAERRRKAAAGLDAVTAAAAGGLDPDLLGSLYHLGTCAEGALAQMGPMLLTPALLEPATWATFSMEVAQRSAAATRQLATGDGLLALEEVRSKIEVFCLVLNVANLIGVPEQPPFELYELLAKAYALGAFQALWGVEGLGHEYGDSFWNQGIVPHQILRDQRTSRLPPESLTMLNAGIGLSMAKWRLDHAGPRPSQAELDALVADVVRLCRDNARPGYLGAALESLGLVTSSFHGNLLPGVEQALRKVAPEVLGYFWHGAGRSQFFQPINFLPGSDFPQFGMAAALAPDEPGRLSAVAGAAWAYTLVNQRDPQMMAELLIDPHGDELAQSGAFANGVASSIMMRYDTTPQADFIEPFIDYRPGGSNRRLARLWDQLVRIPAETALAVYYPVIKRHHRLGDIFEYHDLAAFVARLEGHGPG
jgi:hypothetical protein